MSVGKTWWRVGIWLAREEMEKTQMEMCLGVFLVGSRLGFVGHVVIFYWYVWEL